MAERVTPFDWKLPLYFAAITAVLLISLMAYSAYWSALYIFFLAPVFCLTFLILSVTAAMRKKKRRCLSLLSALAAVVGVSAALLMNGRALRDHVRWLVWSHAFKAQVMAQPLPGNGELRHMEWEATGFAGVANNTAYLVFDPTDSLSVQHPSGGFGGIPWRVPSVRRLEHQWYSVLFYTDEVWGDCPSSRAGGG